MEETSLSTCPHCGYAPQKQPSMDYALQPGTILHGRYLIGRMLGQGGFGITYIGWDLALSRKVAVKEYFPSAYASRDSGESCTVQWYMTEPAREARSMGREMFLREARKMTRVASIPQGVQVQDLFEDNDTAYIVMEYAPGEDLAQLVSRQGPMPWEAVRDLLLPVAEAMQKFHEAGMIHRDLSPDNLKILPNGTVKILDMGAAKDISLQGGNASMEVTKGGFSPPEQYFMGGNTGTWTDVYSLSATMYFALTGLVPPSAVDRMEKDTLRWDLPQLRKVPASVIQALKQGLTLRFESRTQSMKAFADNLCRKSSGGRRKLVWLAVGIAAVLAVVLLAVGLTGHREDPPGAQTPPVQVSATEAPEVEPTGAATEAPVEMTESWATNVLMLSIIPDAYQYDAEQAPVFNSRIARTQIKSVTFLDSLDSMGSNSWDVSQKRDGSVMAWTSPNGTVQEWGTDSYITLDAYDLYIGAEGGINGMYCANLFKSFHNLSVINFNSCFHTDYAESMESMFSNCTELQALDVSGLKTGRVRDMSSMFSNCYFRKLDVSTFDTSSVEQMDYMFYGCNGLTELDLRNFDTSKVTNMSNLFCLASKLTKLDISSFVTEKVTDMSFMFSYIEMTELDLSHFRTPKLTTMAYMFSGSDMLKSIELSSFDISKVTSMMGTFKGCTSLEYIGGVEYWDVSRVKNYDDFLDDGVLLDGTPWEEMFRQ